MDSSSSIGQDAGRNSKWQLQRSALVQKSKRVGIDAETDGVSQHARAWQAPIQASSRTRNLGLISSITLPAHIVP